MNKKKKLPVGISDFKKIIEGNYCYVDKTLFIKEILDRGDAIILIPRPRRFGKTLNLSMLKYFYDCIHVNGDTLDHGYNHLFDSLAIMEAGREYIEKMGKHPVIFMSFRDIKERSWENCNDKLKRLIQDEYLKHDYLQNSPKLKPQEQDYFKQIINLKGSEADYEKSLEKLLIFLNRYYGERAVILIDEYDAPVHAGFSCGYYEEIISFMRNFLCGGLKDTDQYLEKSVLTGIMRVARESIFSGLNNPGVYTLLSEAFNDNFGFTDTEVKNLLREFQVFDTYDDVREWYNGYRFGETTIYNPWSIINFLAEDAKKLKPFWINTSDNAIVESLLSRGGIELKEELEQLIRGEPIEKAVDENIVLKNVETDDNALWSFLLMGGYLKTISERRNPVTAEMYYQLAIPNLEVKTAYVQIVKSYFSTKIENKKLEIMLKALIDGDIKLFEKMLRKIVTAIFSYHDFGGEPEKVYHALVVGLLTWISDTHEIKSNRESGYGRYDIMIIPRPSSGAAVKSHTAKPAYIIEFKAVDTDDDETVPEAVEAAFKQIEEKKYETELIDRGIDSQYIKKLAIVFNGKNVTVKEG